MIITREWFCNKLLWVQRWFGFVISICFFILQNKVMLCLEISKCPDIFGRLGECQGIYPSLVTPLITWPSSYPYPILFGTARFLLPLSLLSINVTSSFTPLPLRPSSEKTSQPSIHYNRYSEVCRNRCTLFSVNHMTILITYIVTWSKWPLPSAED